MMISIVIPVGKEGENLYERVLEFDDLVKDSFRKLGFSHEILLISDIFHVPTLKAMMRLAKQNIARCLFLTRRIGKGGSIKNAIPYIHGDYIVLLDADIPISIDILSKAVLLVTYQKIDLLITNRVYRTHSLLRRTLSTAYNTLVNILFGTGLRDHQAGFKVLSRKAAKIILAGRTRTDGLAYDTEVIVWARKYRFKYIALDVIWREKREVSTIPQLRAILTMSIDLAMLKLLTLAGKYIALQKTTIGKIIDLSSLHEVGQAFTTTIKASGLKKHFLNPLRKLYIITALRKRETP